MPTKDEIDLRRGWIVGRDHGARAQGRRGRRAARGDAQGDQADREGGASPARSQHVVVDAGTARRACGGGSRARRASDVRRRLRGAAEVYSPACEASAPQSLPRTRARRAAGGAEVLAFHRALPGYRPTQLHALPHETEALGLGEIWLKDENGRFGLPAFKIAGASWALERLLAERPGCARSGPRARATTGAPWRAPRHRGAWRRASSCPWRRARRAPPRSPPRAPRSCACRASTRTRSPRLPRRRAHPALRRSPTSPTTSPIRVARWVVRRLLDDLRRGRRAGRRALRRRALPDRRGLVRVGGDPLRLPPGSAGVAIGVEPATAACVTASLAAGRPVVVDTPGTSMAGLNCATPSHAAWPALRDGLTGCVVIGDAEAHAAMRELAAQGIVAGDCGAASLAALHALMRDPRVRRARVRCGPRANQPGAADLDRGRDRSCRLR